MAEEKRTVIELRGFSNILWLLLVMTAFSLGFGMGSARTWWEFFDPWRPSMAPACFRPTPCDPPFTVDLDGNFIDHGESVEVIITERDE